MIYLLTEAIHIDRFMLGILLSSQLAEHVHNVLVGAKDALRWCQSVNVEWAVHRYRNIPAKMALTTGAINDNGYGIHTGSLTRGRLLDDSLLQLGSSTFSLVGRLNTNTDKRILVESYAVPYTVLNGLSSKTFPLAR